MFLFKLQFLLLKTFIQFLLFQVAIVEINADGQDKLEFLERSNSVGSCKSSGHGHHDAAVIALSDLDKALSLEEELFCENREDGMLEPSVYQIFCFS